MAKTFTSSNDDVVKFQGIVKRRIPKDYYQYLISAEQGRLARDTITIPEWHGTETCLNALYGLNAPDEYNLEVRYFKCKDYYPSHLIPIGEDSAGNTIFIASGGHWLGEILFWDHEDELDPDGLIRTDLGNVYVLAPNFTTFMQSLT